MKLFVQVGKIVSLLKAGECNVALFRDVHAILGAVVQLLESINDNPTQSTLSLLQSLRELTQYESGIAVYLEDLLGDSRSLMKRISDTINTDIDRAYPDASALADEGEEDSEYNQTSAPIPLQQVPDAALKYFATAFNPPLVNTCR